MPSLLAPITYASLRGNDRAPEGSRFPRKADRGNSFGVALGPVSLVETDARRFLSRYLGDRLAVFSRIGRAIIYTGGEVAHDRLSAAHHG